MTRKQIRKNKFFAFTTYAKVLFEIANIDDYTKGEINEKYSDFEDRMVMVEVLATFFDEKSDEWDEVEGALLCAKNAKEFFKTLKRYRFNIKKNCEDAIVPILKGLSLPGDIHSPKEKFFLKLQSTFIFLNMLLALRDDINDAETEQKLGHLVPDKIDAVAKLGVEELKDLERRVRERSFPSDVYYLWYQRIVAEFEKVVNFLIGEWQADNLRSLLLETLNSLDFSKKKEFRDPDDVAMLVHLSSMGIVNTSIRQKE